MRTGATQFLLIFFFLSSEEDHRDKSSAVQESLQMFINGEKKMDKTYRGEQTPMKVL